jgi:hypothetical protein
MPVGAGVPSAAGDVVGPYVSGTAALQKDIEEDCEKKRAIHGHLQKRDDTIYLTCLEGHKYSPEGMNNSVANSDISRFHCHTIE